MPRSQCGQSHGRQCHSLRWRESRSFWEMLSLHLLWDLHGVPQASGSPGKCSGVQYKFESHWHTDMNQSQPKRTVREAHLGSSLRAESKGRAGEEGPAASERNRRKQRVQ